MSLTQRHWAIGLRCLALATLLVGTGCKTWSVPNSLAFWKPAIKESDFDSPDRIVVIWADDVLSQPGKPATRGFGGRIYFYSVGGKAIPAEGQLIVYAYDDSQAQQGAERVPTKRFAYTAEQFATHFSESQLGPSYSIWLPWDASGGERKEISLVPVFTSTAGKIVMGTQTTNILPGRAPNTDEQQVNRVDMRRSSGLDSSVRPTSFMAGARNSANANSAAMGNATTAAAGGVDGANAIAHNAMAAGMNGAVNANDGVKMRTTTIAMPKSMSRALQAANEGGAYDTASFGNLGGGQSGPQVGGQGNAQAAGQSGSSPSLTLGPTKSQPTNFGVQPAGQMNQQSAPTAQPDGQTIQPAGQYNQPAGRTIQPASAVMPTSQPPANVGWPYAPAGRQTNGAPAVYQTTPSTNGASNAPAQLGGSNQQTSRYQSTWLNPSSATAQP